MDENDISKVANQIVPVYGEGADLHAGMRADAANARGDNADERH